jgi:acetolactate decarboxylase
MRYCVAVLLIAVFSACSREPDKLAVVKYAGALGNFTQKNDTTSTIFLDTIEPHRRLYGLGPLQGYSGEIMIIDGRPYVSKLSAKGRRRIRQNFNLKAPYFVYAHVRDWEVTQLPDRKITMADLEKLLPQLAQSKGLDPEKPFPFMLRGHFAEMAYKIDYWPKKPKKQVPVTSFDETNADIIVLGFYSRKHRGIFTPEGSNLVMAFMTTSASQVGHIDQLAFNGKKVQLLLPE